MSRKKSEPVFVFPEFDRRDFLLREMRDARVALTTILYAMGLVVVSLAVSQVSVRLAVLIGLAAPAGLIRVLPLVADTSEFERKNWIGPMFTALLTWLGLWILLSNPPFQDLAPPYAQTLEVYTFDGQNWTLDGWDSDDLEQDKSWTYTFSSEGVNRYYCKSHPPADFPDFIGWVNVSNDADAESESVTVYIDGSKYVPQAVKIKPGVSVTWVNNDSAVHTVTQVDWTASYTVAGDTDLVVVVKALDNLAVERVEFEVTRGDAGVLSPVPLEALPEENEYPVAGTYYYYYIYEGGLSPGDYTFRFTVSDGAGYTTTREWAVEVV